MKQPFRTILVLALLFGCVGCDQATKELVRLHLDYGVTHSYLFDTLRLMHTENTGAFLSLGDSLPQQLKDLVFIGGVGLFVLGLLWGAALSPAFERRQVVALSLLAAGGLGNLIDRLAYEGRVTDFLNIGIDGIRTGIFNIADVAAMVGAVLLLVSKRSAPAANTALE
jgi:signal peptidase II